MNPTSGNDRFDVTHQVQLVDPVGRVLAMRTQCDSVTNGFACYRTDDQGIENRYNRFGWLVRQHTDLDIDSTKYDASGNIVWRRAKQSWTPDSFVVAASHNRLTRHSRAMTTHYDMAYDQNQSRLSEQRNGGNTCGDRNYYYDALNRSVGVRGWGMQDFGGGSFCQPSGWLDNCRYDALGRLVVNCSDTAPLLGFDGENIVRAGNWRIIHGPALDDPLIALSADYTGPKELYYVTDGMGKHFGAGQYHGGLDGNITSTSQFSGWDATGSTSASQSFDAQRLTRPSTPTLSFFRNRIYDQATGRWTQEDPIGIAGGLNLYQFNGNDPVTFPDPFGLCPWCFAIAGAVVGGGGRAVYNYMHDRPVGEGVVAYAVAGAVIGGTLGLGVEVLAARGAVATAGGGAAVVGKGTEKLIGLLEGAGPSMDARIRAVASYLPSGQKAIMTTLEGGSRMLSGGSGSRATQVILNADGTSVVKKLNTATKLYEVIKEIKP